MKWDLSAWQQASDLMEQAARIYSNFLQIAANRYRALNSPAAASAPPVNVVETEQACWVVTALPGADANQIESRLHDNELVITGMRRLPTCCAQGEEKVLAAKRAGIGCVLLPELNRKELDEIWPQAREVLFWSTT